MSATTARVRVYAELNDFLPKASRGRDVVLTTDRTSVKDLVERLGVPHTEVDLILVNGEPAGFDYVVRDGDRISVYPVFEAFDISGVTKVRPEPLRKLRFAADAHLGRLATFLRLLGFDVLYQNDWPDDELARVVAGERRVLLTRDRGLLKRTAVERGYCVRSDRLEEQLVQVVRRFDLERLARPFTRCSRCNGVLLDVEKEAMLDRLPPRTREHYVRFQQCRDCGQLYWQGTHHERLWPVLERAGRTRDGIGGIRGRDIRDVVTYEVDACLSYRADRGTRRRLRILANRPASRRQQPIVVPSRLRTTIPARSQRSESGRAVGCGGCCPCSANRIGLQGAAKARAAILQELIGRRPAQPLFLLKRVGVRLVQLHTS